MHHQQSASQLVQTDRTKRMSRDTRLHTLSFLDGPSAMVLLAVDRSWSGLRTDERCCRLLYRAFFGQLTPDDMKLFEFSAHSTWVQRFDIRLQTKLNMLAWRPVRKSRMSDDQLAGKFASGVERIQADTGVGGGSIVFVRKGSLTTEIETSWREALAFVDQSRELVIVTDCRNKFGVWTVSGKRIVEFKYPFDEAWEHEFDDGEMFTMNERSCDVMDYLAPGRPILRSFKQPAGYVQGATMAILPNYVVLSYGSSDCCEGHDDLNCHTVLLRRHDLKVLDRLGGETMTTEDAARNCIVQMTYTSRQVMRTWYIDRISFVSVPVPSVRVRHLNARYVGATSTEFNDHLGGRIYDGQQEILFDFMSERPPSSTTAQSSIPASKRPRLK